MKNVEIKIGDNVELFNGTKGTVSSLEWPMVVLSSSISYTQSFHKANIEKVNDVICDGCYDNILFVV